MKLEGSYDSLSLSPGNPKQMTLMNIEIRMY